MKLSESRKQKSKQSKKAKEPIPSTSFMVRYMNGTGQFTDTVTFHNCTQNQAAEKAQRHADTSKDRYDDWQITPIPPDKGPAKKK